jgi:hypothetical protein
LQFEETKKDKTHGFPDVQHHGHNYEEESPPQGETKKKKNVHTRRAQPKSAKIPNRYPSSETGVRDSWTTLVPITSIHQLIAIPMSAEIAIWNRGRLAIAKGNKRYREIDT